MEALFFRIFAAVVFGQLKGAVGGNAIYNKVFHMRVGLCKHTVECASYNGLGIIGAGDDGETNHSLYFL